MDHGKLGPDMAGHGQPWLAGQGDDNGGRQHFGLRLIFQDCFPETAACSQLLPGVKHLTHDYGTCFGLLAASVEAAGAGVQRFESGAELREFIEHLAFCSICFVAGR